MDSINSLEDAIALQLKLDEDETSITAHLNTLLANVKACDEEIKSLKTHVPDPMILRSDAEELKTAYQFTASLASTISSKMRKLDLVQNRVSTCLQRVTDIRDLQKCTQEIQSALDNEEYENAAVIVQRFLSIDEAQVKKSAQGKSLDQEFFKLHEARKKLEQMVIKKFDEAETSGDVASVERFFKLFPFLNQQEEGLKRFSNYVSSKIPSESVILSSTQTQTHHEQLGALFEAIAKIIDVHQVLVETYYKHGNLIYVLQVIQSKCDQRVKRIFDDFKRFRNFNQVISIVNKSLKSQNSWSSGNVIKVDPRELDTLLIEVILMISRGQTYLTFVKQRATSDVTVAYQAESPEKLSKSLASVDNLIRDCELARIMQGLSGQYVLIEEYFMKESVAKAIEMDDGRPLNESSVASSMLDDVFFIMKNCVRRALSSRNIDVLCAIVNHCITTLDTSYADALNERIKYGFPNSIGAVAASLDFSQAYNALQAGHYLQSPSDLEKTKLLFLTGLNNLDLSSKCILSLKNSISEDANKAFNSTVNQTDSQPSITPCNTSILDCCLQELHSLTNKFSSLTEEGIRRMYLSLLKPRIKIWVDGLTSEENCLGEQDLSQLELSPDALRQFTASFLVELDSIFKDLQPKLTPNCYSQLVSVFTTEVATRIQLGIKQCTFNRLGALQLDKEVRVIINYLISLTSLTLREKFTQLRLVLQILNVDQVSDALDYGSPTASSDASSNKLPPSDVRSILKLRSDLDRSEIRRLKFS